MYSKIFKYFLIVFFTGIVNNSYCQTNQSYGVGFGLTFNHQNESKYFQRRIEYYNYNGVSIPSGSSIPILGYQAFYLKGKEGFASWGFMGQFSSTLSSSKYGDQNGTIDMKSTVESYSLQLLLSKEIFRREWGEIALFLRQGATLVTLNHDEEVNLNDLTFLNSQTNWSNQTIGTSTEFGFGIEKTIKRSMVGLRIGMRDLVMENVNNGNPDDERFNSKDDMSGFFIEIYIGLTQ